LYKQNQADNKSRKAISSNHWFDYRLLYTFFY